jgi:hypothetical protein
MADRAVISALGVAFVGLLLAGCSTSLPPGPVHSSKPDTEIPGLVASAAPVAPPKTITWESACMLSVDEVTNAMRTYSWAPLATTKAGDGFAGDTSCDYAESNPDSTRHVSVDFRAYAPTTTYGWMSDNADVPSFAAPSAAEGAQNACATASSAQGGGACNTAGTVPVVVSPRGTTAVAFPEGKFFYVIQLYGIAGSAQSKVSLLALMSLIADRQLVSN